MRSAPLLLLLSFLAGLNGATTQNQNNNTVFNVGALFTFNSTIGRSARLAIQLAVQDVNSDPNILAGSTLNIIMQDTKCSGFLGITEALQLLEKDVVAIIGPQSSGIGHVISHVVNELHVPLLSFAATDPALSSLEYPYFIRTVYSDYFQMNAVADMITFYGWREVTVIFVDDDYGRGGITALGDALEKKLSKISYKAGFPPGAGSSVINDLLVQVNLMESRIYVVHANPESGTNLFAMAKRLGMLGSGYVWIATDWLGSSLDSSLAADPETMSLLQGVITLRHHTADSDLKRNFLSRWKDVIHNGNASSNLNTYGLFAYDSVWLVARTVDRFLKGGQTLNFSGDPRIQDANGSTLHLSALQSFHEGEQLLQQLLLTNFTGLTGQIQFDSDRNLIHPAYEILNIVGQDSHLIGYWSSKSGLSVVAPETLYKKPQNISTSSQQLYNVIWPGQTTEKPRGWVFPDNGKKLRIGVPNKASFKQLISNVSGIDNLSGLCIDIFNAAVALLPYPVPFSFKLIGNGYENPNYDDIINMVAQNDLDAAVGDIAIVRNRTRIVDFTQPYTESGLVIVVPVQERDSSAWDFMKPFTFEMWCVTGAFFLFVGAVIWILEHRLNPEFRGSPRNQLVTICWFSFSTMFFAHRENTVSFLGRFVLIVWLFVVLIINSSYTASLTSILTVQQLASGIKGLDSLLSSSDPIGYQVGKFARNYMIDELGIHESRLKPLNTVEDYARALQLGPKNGGVSAIVDEMPYIQIFLSTYCDKFRTVGQEFTKNGWGFAFQRDSPLAVDLSTAILTLSENGDLQRIHDKWLTKKGCDTGDADIDSVRLSLRSFWGLFVVCAAACFLALIMFFARTCSQFMYYNSLQAENSEDSTAVDRPPQRLKSLKSFKDLMLFVDKKEKDVKELIKRKSSDKQHRSAGTSDAQPESPS